MQVAYVLNSAAFACFPLSCVLAGEGWEGVTLALRIILRSKSPSPYPSPAAAGEGTGAVRGLLFEDSFRLLLFELGGVLLGLVLQADDLIQLV